MKIWAFIAIVIFAFVVVIACYSLVLLRADEILLGKIALVKPGDRLDLIQDRLGKKATDTDNVEEMVAIGSIKDEAFCRGKRLTIFFAAGPPHLALEVYSEQRRVVYTTWQYF